jgi:hypothetical protein
VVDGGGASIVVVVGSGASVVVVVGSGASVVDVACGFSSADVSGVTVVGG